MVMVKNMVAKLPGSSLDSKDRFGEVRTERVKETRSERELIMR